jgi:hypothetical protein
MKFRDILESGSKISGELITEEWETDFSFEWDATEHLTVIGTEKFKKVLESPCRLANADIILLDSTITYEELDEFTRAAAGYCTVSQDALWFLHTEESS